MIHVVTLRRDPVRALPGFLAAIEVHANSYWKVMPNVWLVDTPLGARQLAHHLIRELEISDTLLVIRARGNFGGQLPEETWSWLETSAEEGDFTS